MSIIGICTFKDLRVIFLVQKKEEASSVSRGSSPQNSSSTRKLGHAKKEWRHLESILMGVWDMELKFGKITVMS